MDQRLRPAQLVSDLTGGARPVEDGDYALYLVVDQDGTVPPADSSLAVVVPGKILIRGLPAAGAGGLQAPAMELLPAQVSMTVDGDTTLFQLRPHSNGQQVDLVADLPDDLFILEIPGRPGDAPKEAAGDG